MKARIHKRAISNSDFMVCGIERIWKAYPILEDFHWDGVTCKNCLKTVRAKEHVKFVKEVKKRRYEGYR